MATLRVRTFVDFWNFTLSIRNEDSSFLIAWEKLGALLAAEAGALLGSDPPKYEQLHIFGSYDPNKPADVRLKNWFVNKLDKMPGVITVVLRERQRKRGYPKCPVCQNEAQKCAACGGDMRGTEEKGVDTRIATDLIRLAWEGGYDAAVLVSADRDFVPVAEFLQTKSIKIIHGAFPPAGSELTQKCWGNLDLRKLMPKFRRSS